MLQEHSCVVVFHSRACRTVMCGVLCALYAIPYMYCVCTEARKLGESLYVMNWLGMLTEYVLVPHVKAGVEKVCDDSPIEMTYVIKAQWPLHRFETLLLS